MTNPLEATTFDLAWVSQLARAAGDIALDHYRQTTIRFKADRTIVTEADHAVEAFLGRELRQRYPNDGILGEEETDLNRAAGRTWVLDPIDGTGVFSAGLPIWCICIGLVVGTEPVAGVVYLPVVDDCFAVGVDGPATLNGEPIQVAPDEPFHGDSILFGSADAHRLWEIDFPGKVRAFGSCAAHFCYVARGGGVGAVNTHTALWDIAAALPILQRAGGRCLLYDGSPLPLASIQDGSKLDQPIVLAPPYFIDDIRRRLRYKDRAPGV